jgi:hypothetical protein
MIQATGPSPIRNGPSARSDVWKILGHRQTGDMICERIVERWILMRGDTVTGQSDHEPGKHGVMEATP